ncbi:hypothetical protein MRX96_038986 [Rhipicephalus microplus]
MQAVVSIRVRHVVRAIANAGTSKIHDEPANDEQNGHPVTSRSAEQTTGLQVLKPSSLASTTSRTPNYWDNAAERERVDEHATLPEPEPLMDAGENGSESSHDGTDTEQAASSSPETSSAETSRASWVVSLSEGEEQKVPDYEKGEELAELLVDEAHFPPLDVGNAPPLDTGITPRVGSDHARTPNPLQPVVNPSSANTTPPAGPANEADKDFPTNSTQPARGRSDRSRSPRAHNRPEDSRQAALTFLNVLMNIYSDFGTAVFVQDIRELAPVNMVIAVSNAFTGVPFLTVNCVSTRLLLMYISRLISLYVRCILKNVDQCLRSWSTTDSRFSVLS